MATRRATNTPTNASGQVLRAVANFIQGGPRAAAASLGGKSNAASKNMTRPAMGKPFSMGVEMSREEALAEVMRLMNMGYDAGTASGMVYGGGGGGGGGYGGGGGGGFSIPQAALDQLAATYASAAATFDGSHDKYRAIHKEERDRDAGATANVVASANQGAQASQEKLAAERKALGIEDAAAVVSPTVANEQKIATDNAARNEARMVARNTGHLDNALEFNTKLKSVVELEGAEKQRAALEGYRARLASIGAGRGGGGGGGRRGGGGSRGGGSRGLTPGQLWNASNDLINDDLRRNHQMYAGQYNQMALNNAQRLYPNASFGNQMSAAKYLFPGLAKKR